MDRFVSGRRVGFGVALVLGSLVQASCGGGSSGGGGSVKAPIGATGGSITSADGRLELVIPEGALASTLDIELQPIEVAGGWGWSMLPHGTTFGKPVAVTLSLGRSEVAAPDKTTEGNAVSVTVEDLAALHVSRTPGGTDAPVELAGGWNEDLSKLVFSGAIDHFSELIIARAGGTRWVFPTSGKVGETLSVQASRLVEAGFTEESLFLQCNDGTGQTLKTSVRRSLTRMVAYSNGSVTISGEGVPLGIPGVDAFKIEVTCAQTGKALLGANAYFGLEREGGLPWPSGCAPLMLYTAHSILIDCTAPAGIAGRYVHTAAPGSCDDDTSTAAWYVHDNGAITNDFGAGCTNGAGTSYATPFAMWKVSGGTLTVDDCSRQVDAAIGKLRSLTYNATKGRWEGTETHSGGTSQVCLTGPEPWDFAGKCVATGCQLVDLTCDSQPKKILNSCEVCPSNCTGCSEPRPWSFEAAVTPVCY